MSRSKGITGTEIIGIGCVGYVVLSVVLGGLLSLVGL